MAPPQSRKRHGKREIGSLKRHSSSSESGSAKETAVKQESPSVQKIGVWTPSPYTAFKILLSARLCSAIWGQIWDCDETFNYLEPLHFLLYGSGFQTWEYSPEYALRSYAYVIVHGLPVWLYTKILQPNKVLVFYFLRCLLGFLCAGCEMYFYKGICKSLGPSVGRLTLALLLPAAGMFISSTALLPSTFSMYMAMLAMGAWMLQKEHIAIFCTALGALLGWPFAALLGIPIAFDIIVVQQKITVFFKYSILALMFIMVPMIQVDSHLYGKLVVAPWNIISYNVFTSHGPDLYGVEHFTYYLINGFLNFNVIFTAALIVFPVYAVMQSHFKFSKKGNPSPYLVLLPMYLWLLVFFTQPHKEERFLFPIYPMLCMSAAVTFDSLHKLYCHWLVGKKSSRFYSLGDWTVWLTVLISGVISVMRVVALYQGYHSSLQTYFEIWRLQEEGLIPQHLGSSSKPVQLCVGKTWHHFPSSFFLPGNWQLQFVQSEFKGQLPKPYSQVVNATAVIPTHMNDMNREERSRYFNITKCHYMIDLDSDIETKLEPRYARQTDRWTVIARATYLDNQKSHRLLRAFYIPWLTESHCQYLDYVLLQSKTLSKYSNKYAGTKDRIL